MQTLVHSRNILMGVSLSWLYGDNSHITSSASDVSGLLVYTALHQQMTHRYCSKFSISPYADMNATKQQYSQPISNSDSHRCVGKLPGSYSSTVSVGWIRLYHVYAHAFTYTCTLSSSIIFTADTSSSSHPCCSCSVQCSCRSRTWARQYIGIHRAFYGVHGSWEPGYDKHRVNDR